MADIELVSLVNPNNLGALTYTYAILPNIKGYKYTIGTTYPGPRRNEEFMFYRYKYMVDSVHCHIKVDDHGQYFIQNARESALIYLNGELLKGDPARIQIGDVFSFGFPHPFEYDLEDFPVFCVSPREYFDGLGEMMQNLQINANRETEQCDEKKSENSFFLEDNSLIFSKILSNLTFKELKLCRFVSRKWNEKVSDVMGKRGGVIFCWDSEYMFAHTSSRVFRYLHEVKQVKPQKLDIYVTETISPHFFPVIRKPEERRSHGGACGWQRPLRTSNGEPGEKLLNDLDVLLKSEHNFKSISLRIAMIRYESDFYILNALIQELGNNLTEFSFDGILKMLPQNIPYFPLKSLMKYEHFISKYSKKFGRAKLLKLEMLNVYDRWVSHIAPIIHKKLESFSSENFLARLYLKQFVKLGSPNLSVVRIKMVSFSVLSYLSRLDNSLPEIILEDGTKVTYKWHASVIQKIIDKNSKTLKCFKITLCSKTDVLLYFPIFPKLRSLSIRYNNNIRIRWGKEGNYLRYSKYLPCLRNLEVVPVEIPMTEESHDAFCSPKEWENDETVFNSFFPSRSEEKFLPLLNLEIHTVRWDAPAERRSEYHHALKMLSNKFPNVRDEVFQKF